MSSSSPTTGAGAQLRLPLGRATSPEQDRFVVSACNRDGVAAVDSWPDWPGGVLALVGPEGCGKSHLARAWAMRTGAFIAGVAGAQPIDLDALRSGPVLLEDADRWMAGPALFHLLNRAEAGASLLLTARVAPRRWLTEVPDLRSRLNAVMAVDLGAPDEVVLRGVMLRFFRERSIRPDRDLLSYLLSRMERSVPAALAVVCRLDEAASASRREVNRALAREILASGEADN